MSQLQITGNPWYQEDEKTYKTRECHNYRSQATPDTERNKIRTRPGSVTITNHRQPLVPRGIRDVQDQRVSQLQITDNPCYREEETHKTRKCHNYRSHATLGTERKKSRTRPGSVTITDHRQPLVPRGRYVQDQGVSQLKITVNPWYREENDTYKTRECLNYRSQATPGTKRTKRRTRPGSAIITDHRQPLVPRGRRYVLDQGVSQLQITGNPWYREEEERYKTRECHNYRSQVTPVTEKRRRTRPGSDTITDHMQPLIPRGRGDVQDKGVSQLQITGNPWYREEEETYKTRECHNYRSQSTPSTERKKRRTRPGSVTIADHRQPLLPRGRGDILHQGGSKLQIIGHPGAGRKKRRTRPRSFTITDHRQPCYREEEEMYFTR